MSETDLLERIYERSEYVPLGWGICNMCAMYYPTEEMTVVANMYAVCIDCYRDMDDT